MKVRRNPWGFEKPIVGAFSYLAPATNALFLIPGNVFDQPPYEFATALQPTGGQDWRTNFSQISVTTNQQEARLAFNIQVVPVSNN